MRERGWKMFSRMKLWFLSREDVDLSVMYKIEFHISPNQPTRQETRAEEFKVRKVEVLHEHNLVSAIYTPVQICIS